MPIRNPMKLEDMLYRHVLALRVLSCLLMFDWQEQNHEKLVLYTENGIALNHLAVSNLYSLLEFRRQIKNNWTTYVLRSSTYY